MLSNELTKLNCIGAEVSDITLTDDNPQDLYGAPTELLSALKETANSALREYNWNSSLKFCSFLKAVPNSDEFEGSLKQQKRALLKEVRAKLRSGMLSSSSAITITNDINLSFSESKSKTR